MIHIHIHIPGHIYSLATFIEPEDKDKFRTVAIWFFF
jgi:hypothetical protein